jgi:bifunctional enzyme CysN/CysC
MATGASNADLAIILVDARKGLLTQTRRHAYDLLAARHPPRGAGGQQDRPGRLRPGDLPKHRRRFRRLRRRSAFPTDHRRSRCPAASATTSPPLPAHPLVHRPHPDRSISKSAEVETIAHRHPAVPLPGAMGQPPQSRLPRLLRHHRQRRVAPGDRLVVAASGVASTVTRILTSRRRSASAPGRRRRHPLPRRRDRHRPRRHAGPRRRPPRRRRPVRRPYPLDGRGSMLPGRQYMLRMGHAWTSASITAIKHRLDVTTLDQHAGPTLALNEIAVCNLATARPLAFDPYAQNRQTGAFILVDRFTNRTAGCGHGRFPAAPRQQRPSAEAFLVGKAARAAALKHQKPMDPLVHRPVRRRQVHRRQARRGSALHRAGAPHLFARRRQSAPRPEPRPRLHRPRTASKTSAASARWPS